MFSPFRVREAESDDLMTGRLEELAKELLSLSSTHVPSLDDIDYALKKVINFC